MNWRRWTMGSLVLIYQMGAAQTYTRKTPEQKAEFYTRELHQLVKLDSQQQVAVYDYNLLLSRRFDSLYQAKPDEELRRQETIRLLRERDAIYRSLLNARQYLQFDDWQREKRKQKQLQKSGQIPADSSASKANGS